MARLVRETRDTIIAAVNDHLVSISDKEEVDVEFKLSDNGVDAVMTLSVKKQSKSGGLHRYIDFRDGVINVDTTDACESNC